MKQTWMLGPEAIHEVGLLGERTVDGVCVTNVPLIGLSENHRGPPEWGRQSHRAMLLALSAVHYFFDIPDVRIAPMAPYLTNRFRQIDNPWIVLADGTVIRKDLVTVALFLSRCRNCLGLFRGFFTFIIYFFHCRSHILSSTSYFLHSC